MYNYIVTIVIRNQFEMYTSMCVFYCVHFKLMEIEMSINVICLFSRKWKVLLKRGDNTATDGHYNTSLLSSSQEPSKCLFSYLGCGRYFVIKMFIFQQALRRFLWAAQINSINDCIVMSISVIPHYTDSETNLSHWWTLHYDVNLKDSIFRTFIAMWSPFCRISYIAF